MSTNIDKEKINENPLVMIREKNKGCYEGICLSNEGSMFMLINSQIIGCIICELRIKRRLTQEVLSGIAGIARSHLAMIENGNKNANVDTLGRIADALDLRLSELIYMAEERMGNI